MSSEKDQMPEGEMGAAKQERGKHKQNGGTKKSKSGRGMPMGSMKESDAEGGMPTGGMGDADVESEMPMGGMGGSDQTPEMPTSNMEGGLQNVLVEMRVPSGQSRAFTFQMAEEMNVSGFQVDTDYEPVPMGPPADQEGLLAASGEETVVIRGRVEESKIAELESQPNVVKVWRDTPIAPFVLEVQEEEEESHPVILSMARGDCAIPPCDCAPGTPKGTIADVARYLGVDQIWASGYRGTGMVIGIVDGGITALGRTPKPGETARIGRVIDGWPTADWGTTAARWGDHGNMTSTDALGMAPDAQVYDIRISDGNAISSALSGFQWAIDRHRRDGTPQILSNSWGIFQESWDPAYARDPNHPFTRKVLEALDEGILVLFAAGNCGEACPDGRCGSNIGPGSSIWGANGHPRVMTVGAVNMNEQWIGYSSQGPAALDPRKPDFCSISHFTGYFTSDSGTSAACPVAAGVVALFKQANPALTQVQAKAALMDTAKDIGPAGWDQHSGAGIIRPKEAVQKIARSASVSGPVVAWGSNRLDVFVIGTDSGLYHKWWNGSAWGPSVTGYEGMGGRIISDPEIVSWGPNRLDVFVVGTDSGLYHKWWNGSAWGPSITGYEGMGGRILGNPKAVAWGPNRLDVFVVGTDSGLYHKWWNGSAWGPSITGYEGMGGYIISDPEVVSWGPNRLDVFVVGTDSGLYHKWWNGSAWGPSLTGWEGLGGRILGNPKVVSWGPNRLDIFVIGTDSALYHKWWNGSAWGPSVTGWEYMGGTIISDPEVVAWGPNRLDVFVVGTDSGLYHKWWNGSAWGPSVTGYEGMGGRILGDPKAVAWGPNRLDVFVVGTNSALYHKWWNGSAWGPSITGYEGMGGTIIRF